MDQKFSCKNFNEEKKCVSMSENEVLLGEMCKVALQA